MRASRWNFRLQPKLLLGLVIMAAVLVSALTPAISQLYRNHMERHYSNLAFDQASIAARLIDGDSIDHAHGGEGQTATRLGAFLEMLEERRAAAPHAAAPTEKAV